MCIRIITFVYITTLQLTSEPVVSNKTRDALTVKATNNIFANAIAITEIFCALIYVFALCKSITLVPVNSIPLIALL